MMFFGAAKQHEGDAYGNRRNLGDAMDPYWNGSQWVYFDPSSGMEIPLGGGGVSTGGGGGGDYTLPAPTGGGVYSPPPAQQTSGGGISQTLASILATITHGLDAFGAAQGYASSTYHPATGQPGVYPGGVYPGGIIPGNTIGSAAASTLGAAWQGIANQFGISSSTLTILAIGGVYLLLKTPPKR